MFSLDLTNYKKLTNVNTNKTTHYLIANQLLATVRSHKNVYFNLNLSQVDLNKCFNVCAHLSV